jgi:hypothetical protein
VTCSKHKLSITQVGNDVKNGANRVVVALHCGLLNDAVSIAVLGYGEMNGCDQRGAGSGTTRGQGRTATVRVRACFKLYVKYFGLSWTIFMFVYLQGSYS